MVKALIVLVLAVSIFWTAYHFVDKLYLAPAKALREDRALPPPPPPPDPALPEFVACLEVQKGGDLLAARAAFEGFIERYPRSSKVDAARDLLGEINADLFFSQKPAPEKQVYLVKSGDVLNRVAMRTKTTPELIMRSNNLTGVMLRIGQKLVVTPTDFSMVISPKARKVSLYNGKRFFKQYQIQAQPGAAAGKAGATPAPVKLTGKVVDKMALNSKGERVTFQDKDYAGATHKVTLSIPGYSLYTLEDRSLGGSAAALPKGLGLSAADMEEIAVLLSKNDPVTIE